MFYEQKNRSLAELIHWLRTDAPKNWEELVFIPEMDERLKQSLFLHRSSLALSLHEYEAWRSAGGVLLARTIDGDYIGEKQGETFFLPHSLVREDIKVKSTTFLELLVAYENSQAAISTFFD
ncbi:hypothetical protein RV11_GL001077 [Enterococcus phoeniculicola]|jgi:hypothetical protein|uniref:Uncharacterized protein n=1 Tax=Enterococcus phoeniculicola ATCC BAA-412 TaxID=1158610 RepID=R3W8W2_9ENTE|nr:hypothetical protein [Enterococcus phoeniculicola]EOL43907.1 hypothetical protein UC3_01888 [Enterococcus phoeniculicola ATCC BAA-412]EOT76729.1 hypothetical protein I589_01687 [Enterococcus phoeniculicola ATCC BAA-412]OJG70538.1 hypothetical protein RV11_GL001077 [Enterococcus phoeniculicola]